MQCIVIDDEPYALELVVGYIKRTPFLSLSGGFTNPYKGLSALLAKPADLLFIDINMPELTGLQLLKSLISPPMIIFTTAYAGFGAESYDYNAVDYLLKPIRYERFLKAANKAAGLYAAPLPVASDELSTVIHIKSGTQVHHVKVADILFLEGAGNYMTFHTSAGRILSLLTMAEALAMLPPDGFLRIHKSYIIGLKHIQIVGKHDVVVAGKEIPIGVTYREHAMLKLK